MKKPVDDFETLEEVIVFYCDERNIQPRDIKIGGWDGGVDGLTEDDTSVFITEDTNGSV
jgi:hypothetical protein